MRNLLSNSIGKNSLEREKQKLTEKKVSVMKSCFIQYNALLENDVPVTPQKQKIC